MNRRSSAHPTTTGRTLALALAAVALLGPVDRARASPVGPALSLDDLFQKADVVVKATAGTTQLVEDASFQKTMGYLVTSTELAVLESYKGDAVRGPLAFHHYARDEKAATMERPPHSELMAGRTYIVFAAKTDEPGVVRPLLKMPSMEPDQSVVLAAGPESRTGHAIRDIVRLELTGLLRSEATSDVGYALTHLDAASSRRYGGPDDFDRTEVLAAVEPSIRDPRPEIAQAAIKILGSGNPYLTPDWAAGWLATIGGGQLKGYARWEPAPDNLGARIHGTALAALVDGKASESTRALAVRALGFSVAPEVAGLARRWTSDPAALVRAAAAVLLADHPDEENRRLLERLAADSAPAVRRGVAQAIGLGRFHTMLAPLKALLHDADELVVGAAATSLVSFPIEVSRATLKSEITHPTFRGPFVNALATEDPEPYLAMLAETIRVNPEPRQWGGAFVVWGEAWEILFRYAQKQPTKRALDGELDAVFDALEVPASKKPGAPTYYSSSEPRDLYALYLQVGLGARAGSFRTACRKAVSYDIDPFFNMADRSPGTYRR